MKYFKNRSALPSPEKCNRIGRNCDFGNLRPQKFSLPSTIVYYIFKNPASPSVYQKLIKTCKYFYPKNPIIVVDYFGFSYDGFSFHTTPFAKREEKEYFQKDIRKISCKFWITDKAEVNPYHRWIRKFLHKKIFRINGLFLTGYFNLKLEKLLRPETAQFVTVITFGYALPRYADGTLMPIEKIFDFFPNLEVFRL